MTQQRLHEAGAEVEARKWEKKISDTVFQEINQELRRWADQARRDKISLYGDMELRSRLFQEDHARDCQEVEEMCRDFTLITTFSCTSCFQQSSCLSCFQPVCCSPDNFLTA